MTNRSKFEKASVAEQDNGLAETSGRYVVGHHEEARVYDDIDVFGREDDHQIKYKTLTWQTCALLMTAEIVSNGMLSLPSSLAVVGIVPGIILIIFLGVFATYTSWLLVQFKLRHPEVHNMGDAGFILFGPIGREVFAFGTVCLGIFFSGSQLIVGQVALASLSESKLCLMLYTGIFAIPILLLSFPRTFGNVWWLALLSSVCILVAGIVGMAGAGAYPVDGRSVQATQPGATFYTAFFSITNPVFAYAGHFMFFVLISEMKRPQDAMKAAYAMQGFATTFYVVFAVVCYVYIGDTVLSPVFSSLAIKWQKAAYAIAIPNFIVAGALCSHTATKLLFVRIFRKSRHLHSHTMTGWGTWTVLIIITNGLSFLLAVGVPIFSYLNGITAALFAAWYTYGIAGMFWLHDSYHDGNGFLAWRKGWLQTTLCILTILAGAFICVAGTYVVVQAIVDAYANGTIGSPFSC